MFRSYRGLLVVGIVLSALASAATLSYADSDGSPAFFGGTNQTVFQTQLNTAGNNADGRDGSAQQGGGTDSNNSNSNRNGNIHSVSNEGNDTNNKVTGPGSAQSVPATATPGGGTTQSNTVLQQLINRAFGSNANAAGSGGVSVIAPDASSPRIVQGIDNSTQQELQQTIAQNVQDAVQHATATRAVVTAITVLDSNGRAGSQSAAASSTPGVPASLYVQGSHTNNSNGTTSDDGRSPATSSNNVAGTPVQSPGSNITQLEEIGRAVHAINVQKAAVQQTVSNIVSQSVDQSLTDVSRQTLGTSTEDHSFNPIARQQELDQIKTQSQQITGQINTTIAQAPQTSLEPQSVDPVLKSSIQDIATLIQAQTGVAVDLSPGSRQVTEAVNNAAQNIAQTQQVLAARDGLDLYRDSDGDGISDYDEVNIYHTDPHNAYTAGGTLTDGERILLGLDPHATTTTPVAVELPQDNGVETKSIFEVTNIAVVPVATSTPAAPTPAASTAPAATASTSALTSTTSTAPVVPVASAAPAPSTALRFSGSGLPNSFVTLYIFSTPIVVTVKTDENGLWTYTLDKPLEDGSHQLYVTTVDDGGRILVKSPPIPFTKSAEALDYSPLTIQTITGPSPEDILRQHIVATGFEIFLAFALIGLITIGVWRQRSLPPTLAA